MKSLIIHEENTKEIMSVKEFVYLIQNHADLYKLKLDFLTATSSIYFKLLKTTNVLIRYNTVARVGNSAYIFLKAS
jgi:hypothetical protein